MIRLTFLQTLTGSELDKGHVWVNPRHIVFLSANPTGGTRLRMSNGDLIFVSEDASEIASVAKLYHG